MNAGVGETGERITSTFWNASSKSFLTSVRTQILVDGSADERIFLYSESAIKLGIFTPLTVEIDKMVTKSANPDVLSVWEALGATRMYEEKVIEILCDPIA